MKREIMEFWNEEDGVGTVEILIIVGILVAVAVIFRKAIIKWVEDLIEQADPLKVNKEG